MAKKAPKHRFSTLNGPSLAFRGGDLFIAFVNTAQGAPGREPRRMATYSDFIAWGHEVMPTLSSQAPENPEAIFLEALGLRSALWRIATALTEKNDQVPANDLAFVNHVLGSRSFQFQLKANDETIEGDWGSWNDGRDLLWQIAASAAVLFVEGEERHVRRCAARGCGRFLMDRFSAKRRRFCDPKICGNRDRVRRFYRTYS